ncbi:lysophosphatidic acid receptor 4-like [Dendronephthya gigantea]|uniref:lysophosphatidic acid receptor 4-like n=1 Tax=Dendronephthya gigantea TaxID=151771 RepID=UPI00106DABDC|nr:lysophosphatidic acid receptor 4-like [Dendronephthya gigantea]XP_028402770.1 lysophosphatidic acid receptor 4-like [Dendronephthya gigantea]
MTINATGAFMNTLLIIAIVLDPLKLLRKGAWITILNLALADFISSVSNFLDVGFNTLTFRVSGLEHVKIIRFVLIFGISASFMLLTVLTIETYIVTKFPIRSRLMLTVKRSVLFCLTAWVLALPFGLSNIAYRFTTDLKTVMKVYIGQIAALELVVVVQVIIKFLIIGEIMKSRENTQQQQSNIKHKEVAKTIVILNAILIVTALPFFVSKQLEFLWKVGLVGGDRLVWTFSNYYEPIAAINYLANPILYALRWPDYRRTLFAPFAKFKRKGVFCFWVPSRLTQREPTINADDESSPHPESPNVTTKF